VEVYAEVRVAVFVEEAALDGVGLDASQGLHASVLRVRAAPHLLDDEEGAEVVEVRLASSGRACRADSAVNVEARAEYGRVADATGNLPRETARRRHAADFALRVDAVAVDRAVEVLLAKQTFLNHLQSFTSPDFGALRRVEVVRGVCAPLPFEPEFARVLCVEVVFDCESHVARERLRAVADDEVVVSVLHHGLRDERGRANAFERRDRARAPAWAVHAGGVELHDAFCVRQPAVADAVLRGVEFEYVDSGDEGVENVSA